MEDWRAMQVYDRTWTHIQKSFPRPQLIRYSLAPAQLKGISAHGIVLLMRQQKLREGHIFLNPGREVLP